MDPTDTRTGDQRYTGDFTIQPVESDDQSELYPALQKLKGSNPSLKTLLSIGGWSINSGDDQSTPGNQHPYGPYTYRLFSQMSANPAGRTQFITSAISYAQQYGFDGIDIDWEYPAYLSRGGTPDDLANFLTLVQEFRANVPSGLLLTMAAPAIVPTGVPQQYHADPQSYFTWLAQCAAEFDWLNVMTYDFHGAFDPITGVNAPLAQDSVPGGPFSIANTVKAYLAAAIPKEKIVLGWDNYLFADDAKMQGYYSVGYQLHFEQNGEAAAKALDNGVARTATLFHYIGFVQPTPGPRPPIGISRDATDIWVEQPGNVPSDTLTLDGVKYRLDKGRDGTPVSRQQQITDLDALNEAIAQDYVTAETNYTPQYDVSGNLQNAEPVRRLAQYVAQTQYHSESLTHSNPQESDHDAMRALLKLFGVTSDNYQDILNAAQSDNSTLRTQSIVAQVVENFVPFATLIGSLVQYGMNKALLDWKKRETQMQGRATFYIDEQEKENEQVMMGAAVQSVFDIAASIIGPGDGLLVTVLKGVKNFGQKAIKGGSAFAKAVADALTGTSAFRQLIGDESYAREAAVVEEIKNSHPELKSISTELLVAVRGYTSRDFQAINVALRTGDPAELARLDPYIKAATEGLSQLPSYTGTVWRGAALTDSIVANYATEQVLTERAFLSTSADIKGYFSHHNTEFVIQSNGGGKDVSAVSFLPEQKEVLFPPGTLFKVLGVELKSMTTGKNIIYLNELK